MATDDPRTVERIEWEELGGGARVNHRDVGFVASLLALLAVAYRYSTIPEYKRLPLVGGWDPLPVDWVFFGAVLILVFYGVVPLARSRELVGTYWGELRGRPIALASLAWLTLFFLLGTFEPVIVGKMGMNPLNQPPVGVGIYEGFVGTCVGPVSGETCYGSLAHPLGTNGGGRDMLALTVAGMRTALTVTLVTATIIVPLGIGVGTVAAYFGGRIDEFLMRYVDIQQTLPALFIYMAVQVVVGPSLMLMIVVFGLLNWGDTARLVRSEVLSKRELEFVTAARNAGVGRLGVIRRHIIPNVSTTVLTSATMKLPTLIIIEATLSYLKLGDPRIDSWGNVISLGVLGGGGVTDPTIYWWIPTFPVLALVLTVVALNLFGNALQDVLDPRRQP